LLASPQPLVRLDPSWEDRALMGWRGVGVGAQMHSQTEITTLRQMHMLPLEQAFSGLDSC